MSFILGSRAKVPMRVALTGPTNAGKTYTALIIAYGAIKAAHPELSDEDVFKKIAFIDTERGRALFYINRSDLPTQTKEFYHMNIDAPYHPEKYINAVKEASKLVGETGFVIVDSLSHAWNYEGGILSIKNDLDLKGGNSYTNWANPTKLHDQMMNTMLSINSNLIVSMRSKSDYVIELNSMGKSVPKQVGLKPIQRDDTEFEFDITLMLDKQHTATIIKDTTFISQFADEQNNLGVVTPELGKHITEWLNKGTDHTVILEQERLAVVAQIKQMAKDHPQLVTFYKAGYPNIKTNELDLKTAKKVLAEFINITGGK